MKRIALPCVCMMAFLAIALPSLADENYLFHRIDATILVADVEISGDRLEEWTDAAGGYLLRKSNESVVIRLPYTEVGRLRDYLEEISETVVAVSLQATDLRESILGIQSGIDSREEILEKNLTFIDQADVSGTLAIEKEIMQLLSEIEGLKGSLRKVTVDRAYAWAQIYLRFMDQSLPSDIPSSFRWINTVDFYEFMRESY